MKKLLLIVASVCLIGSGYSTPKETVKSDAKRDAKMAWWNDAKFGMFIHWGLYSVPAGKWNNRNTYGEWIMHQASLSRGTYADFARQFNPTQFNAEEWVKLAKAAGQKYIVITSKHHDGFAMFKSQASPYNIVDATPFKRDVIAELAQACRKHEMKLGLYYSQAQDWYHPGGASSGNKQWDSGQKGQMMDYVKKVALPQVKEILSQYGDIAVLWWDTPTNITAEMAKMFEEVVKKYPNMITNNRLGGGSAGDLETPEQFIPATGFPGRNWEVCMTMNGHWGYNAYDENWKSTRTLVRMLIDIVSKGGNFLLNVGPNQEGVIPQVNQTSLTEIGEWLSVNGEAIYGTTASPFPYLSWGRATRNGDKLYLHVFDWPTNGTLRVPMSCRVKSAYLMADKTKALKVKQSPDAINIQMPAYAPDKDASVVVVELGSEPIIEPIHSTGKMVKVSSTKDENSSKYLTDGNPQNRWSAAKGERKASLEIDLGAKRSIQAMSLVEPWYPWDYTSQSYELQASINGEWVSVTKGKTPGTGCTVSFERTNAQLFRLLLESDKNEPSLKEWILF